MPKKFVVEDLSYMWPAPINGRISPEDLAYYKGQFGPNLSSWPEKLPPIPGRKAEAPSDS